MQKIAIFDTAAFHAAIDATRAAHSLDWKDVAAQTGVSASTLTRVGQGKNPDANSIAALVFWADLSTSDFIRCADGRPMKTAPSSVGAIGAALSADSRLTPEMTSVITEVLLTLYRELSSQKISA